jgi:hypothetical protein
VKYFTQAFQLLGVAASLFIGFLLIRSAWTHDNPTGERLILTLLAATEVWCFVSTWRWSANFRRASGFKAAQLLLGPQPSDEIAIPAWKWGRQFRYAWLTLLTCLIVTAYYVWKQN